MEEKNIRIEPDFMIESVDQDAKVIRSYDEREIAYDLLVTVPLNMGADFVARSGLGDELNYVPVDKHTFRSTEHDTIFALGDASNIPTSKAGVGRPLLRRGVHGEPQAARGQGKPMTHRFDGHANCFVESGGGKALLLDFNYDTEPLTGTFPLPKVGPMSLLKESRANHLGKLAFRHIYWNALLPGRPLGLKADMSMAGKHDRVTGSPAHRHLSPPSTATTCTATTEGADNRDHHDHRRHRPTTSTRKASSPTRRCGPRRSGTDARQLIGIEMTEAHWTAIHFLRDDYGVLGETATLRRVSTQAGMPVKELFALFPKKPAKKMAYVAGLPKPKGCV